MTTKRRMKPNHRLHYELHPDDLDQAERHDMRRLKLNQRGRRVNRVEVKDDDE